MSATAPEVAWSVATIAKAQSSTHLRASLSVQHRLNTFGLLDQGELGFGARGKALPRSNIKEKHLRNPIGSKRY
jgi:hypothetical protein